MGNRLSSENGENYGAKRRLKLTFGVELEFILRFPRGKYPSPTGRSSIYYRPLLWSEICDCLEAAGLKTYGQIGSYKGGRYQKWTVKADNTINPPHGREDDEFICLGFEVTTPILRATAEGYSTLRKGVEAIVSQFDVFCNDSCGLHVHVGNNGANGYNIRTVQTLAGLLIGFEEQFNSFHPQSRCEAGSWCTPLSLTDALSRIPSMFHRLLAIQHTESLEKLIDLVNSQGNAVAYNFYHLLPGDGKLTIEFRQHEGTMDVERIISWVQVVTGVVEFAQGLSSLDFIRIFREEMGKEVTNFSALDLLRLLNVEHLIPHYEGRVRNLHSPSPEEMGYRRLQ